MKSILVGVAIIVLGVLMAGGGYYYGLTSGEKRGEAMGYKKGYDEAPKGINPTEYFDLRTKYNGLIDDYNSLVEYARTPQYQPRQPINCTSSNFGGWSTYTTCY